MDKMTDARILEIIAAYGAEPEAWPDAERAACEAAIAGAPDAFADALIEAQALDVMVTVESAMPPAPSEALIAAIIADAPTQSQPVNRGGILSQLRDMLLPQGQRWPAMAAAASLIIGLGFGLALEAPAGGSTVSDDEIVYAALGLSDYSSGFEELN